MKEQRQWEMGPGATQIPQHERERHWKFDSEFAIDKINMNSDMEHLLEDMEREILTIAQEIQEIEDEQEQEQEFNMGEPNTEEIKRCLMRVQEIEEREQEIDDIEKEIKHIQRGKEQERENERHRNDSILTPQNLDDIEIAVEIERNGNLLTDMSAIYQVTVVLDQIERLIERRRRDNTEEEGRREQRVVLELAHIETLVESESIGPEGCEELRDEIDMIERLIEQDQKRDEEMQRQLEKERGGLLVSHLEEIEQQFERDLQIDVEIFDYLLKNKV